MAETKSIVRAEEGNRAYAGSGTWQETPRQTLGLTSSDKYQAWLEQKLSGLPPPPSYISQGTRVQMAASKNKKKCGKMETDV